MVRAPNVYNYFRDYDPAIGRYLESDPIGLASGTNTFGYVSGMPLIHFDIWGLCEYMGYDAHPGTEFKFESADKTVDTRGGPIPNWSNPKCSWYRFLPPGRLGKTPPCKPEMNWETWDQVEHWSRQFSRDYEDQDHIYVCDPKCGNDDGIRHVWQRKYKGDWRRDTNDFLGTDWRRREPYGR